MEYLFQHPKTFRAEIIQSSSKKVLFALHGYGQLSKFFIRRFDQLQDEFTIVAPEGMHRFYRNGTSGRVGASWMTKEMRLTDIDDNVSWLSALRNQVEQSNESEYSALLGFSQGGSTAIRWAKRSQQPFSKVIIWGADFPPEEIGQGRINAGELIYVIGTKDEFFDDERRISTIETFINEGFTIVEYSGGHDIDTDTLRLLFPRD